MKKFILLALITLMMVGCDIKQPDGTYKPSSYRTYVIDSCEYVGYAMGSQYDYLAHKGNCRFCKERDSIKWEKRKKESINNFHFGHKCSCRFCKKCRQKELEELATKLEEK